MEVIIEKNRAAATKLAAELIASFIRKKPSAVIGCPTGSTPIPLYNELIRLHKEEGLDFSQVVTFNLDEYVGLAHDHPASYTFFMHDNLFKHINIKQENVHIPNGMAKDIPAECEEYEKKIKTVGGIDIQILGIGRDGHIAFNEPMSSLGSRTRIKTLTEQSRKDNSRFFKSLDEVPHHVMTMGIGTIMETRRCILLAFGAGKAESIAKAVEGSISAMVPASVLQLHPAVQMIIDEVAASRLSHIEYYRYVYKHKPEWQR